MSRTFSSEGIVLKRMNFSEADRIVTIYTEKFGKITAIAKGARKLSSRKKGGLEPGTISKCFFARGKGMPIITQAEIVDNFSNANDTLTKMTQAFQVLEIVDSLTPDEEANEEVYVLLIESLRLLGENGSKKKELLDNIRKILKELGFGPPKNMSESDLKLYIEDLANRSLKAKKFLTPRS
jgi:DNA repair protein RecO (recombination protein O)